MALESAKIVFDDWEAAKARRAEQMPTENDCLRVMMEAYSRLKELGWNDIIYCPKDGAIFDSISVGSTGVHECSYRGEWPNGHWEVYEAGDIWPAHPAMFRKRQE